MLYAAYGIRIDSELTLPAPLANEHDAADLHVELTRAAPPPAELEWFGQRLMPDGRPWMSIARSAEGDYLLRAHGDADFWLDPGARVLRCSPTPGSEGGLEQLVLDQVLPQVLHAAGHFCFHASAVSLATGAIALLGRGGTGKSTLAATLANEGALLTDDCLRVDVSNGPLHVFAGPSCVRLWPDSAGVIAPTAAASPSGSKLRVPVASSAGRAPLGRIYLIGQTASAPRIQRLSRRDAMAALVHHVFRLDHRDRRLLALELDVLERVVSRVPVALLEYPRDYDALGDVAALVRADAATADAATVTPC